MSRAPFVLFSLLLGGCADLPGDQASANPFPDRAVERPDVCPDGPPTRYTMSRSSGTALPASVRLAWRPDAMAPWQEVGRIEGPNAWADLPRGGEIVALGVGTPGCARLSGEDAAPVNGGPLAHSVRSVRAGGWECTRDVSVVDAAGAPVAGAQVWVAVERRGKLRDTLVGWTDADGRAVDLPAPCGPSAVGAMFDGVGVWGSLDGTLPTTLTLPSPELQLSGRVRSGDVPVAGAEVSVGVRGQGDRFGGPMLGVVTWTDADGRWSAALGLPEPGARRVPVEVVIRAKGYLRDYDLLDVLPGTNPPMFVDLTPARRVHLRCVGAPADSCDDGGYRTVRCGPPGDLELRSATTVGPDGNRQMSVDCADVPDLRLSLDGDEVVVYDDVAWFDVR